MTRTCVSCGFEGDKRDVKRSIFGDVCRCCAEYLIRLDCSERGKLSAVQLATCFGYAPGDTLRILNVPLRELEQEREVCGRDIFSVNDLAALLDQAGPKGVSAN